MPLRKLKRAIRKQQAFDWFAILILASFGFIVSSIVDNDIQKFGKEMDAEARYLEAEILLIKDLRHLSE